jgi:hypothetical protein
MSPHLLHPYLLLVKPHLYHLHASSPRRREAQGGREHPPSGSESERLLPAARALAGVEPLGSLGSFPEGLGTLFF